MASKSQLYVEEHAHLAMENMRLYSIPASVTLAQAILESANGESRLAATENNHFGIKATKGWIESGGRYGLYKDDKPNEKFCSYDKVADSYEHHSRFLKENQRYADCFKLAPDDYKGWAQGLDKAGYATAGSYAPSLISIIERLGLQKYDEMVMKETQVQSRESKVQSSNGKSSAKVNKHSVYDTGVYGVSGISKVTGAAVDSSYSFPLKRDEFMFVTSAFGSRKDPMDSGKTQFHKGIDIRCDNEPVLATESKGRVVEVNDNAATPSGKSVTVEYCREDGSKVQVYCCHLSSVNVKVGDAVEAGQTIAISGNSGTRTTGPHLHFGVKQISEDGTSRDLDPAAYLAEIAQRGNLSLTALHNGKDILEKYREEKPLSQDGQLQAEEPDVDADLSPDDWMKKLLSSEDSGVALDGMGDPVVELVMTMFTSLMALAVAIDGKSDEEAMQSATDSAVSRRVDLAPLAPGLKECQLAIGNGRSPSLLINDGRNSFAVELTQADVNRLSHILQNPDLSSEEKQQRVSSFIGNAAVSAGMSQNYRLGLQGLSQEASLQRTL